jgi:hypothetical protein
MKNSKCWLAVLVAGIVGNALDFVVQNKLLTSAYYSKIDALKQDTNPGWFIFGDFVAVAVLAWAFGRLAAAIGDGAKGGAAAGLTLGVLVNFPTFHFIFLTTKGYPYQLAWINTIYGILWYVVVGAIIGAIMKKPAAA